MKGLVNALSGHLFTGFACNKQQYRPNQVSVSRPEDYPQKTLLPSLELEREVKH